MIEIYCLLNSYVLVEGEAKHDQKWFFSLALLEQARVRW